MSYTVYRVSYTSAPRNHQDVFVESNADKSGELFHVVGSIQKGMTYEAKSAKRPEDSDSFHSKKRVGAVLIANYGQVDAILKNLAPPKKQFDGSKRLNRNEPLRRCQEWTTEAIQALKSSGVLKEESSGSHES